MKKIAIITLNGYFNYGNRLQNYALQETINSFGFEVETIINSTKPKIENSACLLSRVCNLIKKNPKQIYKTIINKINKNEIIETERIRTKIFKDFTYNYISETNYFISEDNIPNDLSDRYNYFITGSDQVWNPSYLNDSSINFLTFAPSHKRISYAPSFGVSEIKPEYVENYKQWISEMHRLSVREDAGAKIIKDLTGRDAPVLVDPTLLLTKEKWLFIAKEADNKPKKKYMLTYFLGGVPKEYKKQIKDIVKKNNLEVINLGDIKEKETYITGPSEFIDYINSCSIFCTDSFHGCVFAILMKKPFIVYERQGTSLSMFSRINTLLDKFNLNSRKVENIKTNNDILNVDYSHIPSILEAERAKASDYLKEALNIKDEN